MLIFSDAFPTNMSDNFYHTKASNSCNCVVDPVYSYTKTLKPSCSRDFHSELYNNTDIKQELVTTCSKNSINKTISVFKNLSDHKNLISEFLLTSGIYPDSCNLDKTCLPIQTQCYLNQTENSTHIGLSYVGAHRDHSQTEFDLYNQWLLLHTDIIQQHNISIIKKDKQIHFLKKDNFLLKEKLKCLEQIIAYNTERNTEQNPDFPEQLDEEQKCESESFEDMTEDSCNSFGKEEIEVVVTPKKEDFVSCTLEVIHFGSNIAQTINKNLESEAAIGLGCNSASSDTKSDVSNSVNKISKVNNFREFNPFKNSKMNMRRRRVDSGSGSDTVIVKNKDRTKKLRRRSKSHSKGSSTKMLTSKEPYVNQVNSENNAIIQQEEINAANTCNLEVPSWRIKLFSSLYTMEGTENLDDEVYNKRHCRPENDERRRKRWDVQRIREQRIVEKLKQRQDRIGVKGDGHQEALVSLWPKPEDIRFIEVAEEIPVAAFGHPLPKSILR